MSGGGDRGGAPGADRARGALLAHMRHELRTPVNAILGYSEMLIEDQAAGPAKDDLRKVEAAGRNLLDLINEILAFATTCARRSTPSSATPRC